MAEKGFGDTLLGMPVEYTDKLPSPDGIILGEFADITTSSPWIDLKPTRLQIFARGGPAVYFDLIKLTFCLKVSEYPPQEGQVAAVWSKGEWYIAYYNGVYWEDGDKHNIFDVEIYVPLPSVEDFPKEFSATGSFDGPGSDE